MRRREFIGIVGGVAAAWPLMVRAQQQAVPVIGFAMDTDPKNYEIFLARLRKGLAEYGYVEGQNLRIECQESSVENLPILFRKFVDEKVTLIVTNTTVTTEVAKATTQSIPIVFNVGSDPVEKGFVSSLNKPGGNMTGIFSLSSNILGKRLEVLHELLPSVTKIAFLTDPRNSTLGMLQMAEVHAAANSFGLSVLNVYARGQDEFEAAFDTAVRNGAGGMVHGSDGLFGTGFATQLVALEARYRLPTIYNIAGNVKAGGLISYSTDWNEMDVTLGRYAGRILKGTKPADLPVQLPTKTNLIINLKTAKALGITVPPSLLASADEVIE
jgi:putative ABC transport system substrate-binding protein